MHLVKTLSRGAAANAFAQAVAVATQLLLLPIMTHYWGAEKFGVWALAFTIPSFFALADLGFASAAGNSMTMATATGDFDRALKIFHSATFIVIVASILAALLAITIITFQGNSYGRAKYGEIHNVAPYLVIYSLASLNTSLVQAGFRSNGSYALGTSLNAIGSLVESSLAAACVIAGQDIFAVAVTVTVTRIINFVAQIIVLKMSAPWLDYSLKYASVKVVMELLPVSATAMIIPVSQALILQGTVAVIGAVEATTAVAAFVAVRTMTRSGLQFNSLINHAIMPLVSSSYARGQKREIELSVGITVITGLIMNAGFFAAYLILGDIFLRHWSGPSVKIPTGLVFSMATAMLFNGLWNPMGNLLLSANLQKRYSPHYLFLSICAVALSVSACRIWGSVGVAMTMAVSEFIMLLIVIRACRIALLGRASYASALSSTIVALRRALVNKWFPA